MKNTYAIGLDFGSLSGRALLVNLQTGEEAGMAVMNYPHGFIEEKLPVTGETLPPDWTLQDPADYLEVLTAIVPKVMAESGVDPEQVVGIGVDFTASTVMPVKRDGTPLAFLPEFKNNKHAYVKKWKHHAAQPYATKINEIGAKRGESFLKRYGEKISSEWLVPKAWQILDEAPEVYDGMDMIMEAGDWLVMQLTGELVRSSCGAGYKGLWSKRDGYPDKAFFKALDPRLENFVEEKLIGDVKPLGAPAGKLTPEMADKLGLKAGTAVAMSIIDAHVAIPAVGIDGPNDMLLIIGTSTCHIMMSENFVEAPGIAGIVEDGVLPGFTAYEAGQSCVGDHFDWFVSNLFPAHYAADAAEKGMNAHQYLRSLAEKQKPGEHGLLALDWWNGNRSVLMDADLTGMMLGMTLQTRAEDIYRALLEATAYGTREIIETFEENGLEVKQLHAAGGIALKDPLMMQIYADVNNRSIEVSKSKQTPALGAAMFGAVAAGKASGGFDTIQDAIASIPLPDSIRYEPIPENVKIYEQLYHEYKQLHDYFGRGGNDVMKRLKALRERQLKA